MHTDHPFTEKQDVFQLPDFAAGPYSVICDFDGTVTPFDVTDAILERFARPAWKTIEDEWVRGAISARRCMERQIPLIEAPLGAAGRLSGHGPRHRRVRGIRAVRPLRKASPSAS